MQHGRAFLLFIVTLASLPLQAEESGNVVRVADPFLELHTGPGRGYPIFYVVERDELITILKRKTQWYKIKTEYGQTGWAWRGQMEETLTLTGEKKKFVDIQFDDYLTRRWELGVLGGELEGASQLTIYGGYAFTNNISGEVAVSQAIGNFSTNQMLAGSLVGIPFPEWRITPFFAIGYGIVKTEPRVTLVRAVDRSDGTVHAGFGLRSYLTRQFMIRWEYNNHVVFSSDDNNEELREWKAGLAFFF